MGISKSYSAFLGWFPDYELRSVKFLWWLAAIIWGMLSEQKCKKYCYPVIKYSITFGIKSPKCLVGCFCRLILFAWSIKALFEIQYAKFKIHTPFNSTACWVKRKKSVWQKKMTLLRIPPLRELDLLLLIHAHSWEKTLAFQSYAECGGRQSLPEEGLQATSPALRWRGCLGEQWKESSRLHGTQEEWSQQLWGWR